MYDESVLIGDSSERLVDRVYTHFPDKFMTNQMDLVQFECSFHKEKDIREINSKTKKRY